MPTTPDARTPRRIVVLQNTLLVLFGLAAGLGASELVARVAYGQPWYSHLADEQRTNETLNYRMNAYDLRGDDFETPKPPDHRRVYMAGDSFTFGMGVRDGSLVMPALVEAELNRSPPVAGVDAFDVLNGGMLKASLPRDWLKKWGQVGEPYDPDVVLIVFFLRDGTNTGSIPAFFNVIRNEIAERNNADPWYRRSYLFRTFRDRKDRQLVAGRYTEAFRRAYFGTEEEQEEWRDAQYRMLKLKEAAEARGAVVGMVTYPILVNLAANEPYPFQDICDLLADFARSHDLPLLELLPSFRGEHGPSLWVSAFDQHPNEKGHAIAADAVTPFVEDLLRRAEARRDAAATP
ncbi:MAG: SGNH/GDSL hydrolase family protein [Acidobacteriota bacterium]